MPSSCGWQLRKTAAQKAVDRTFSCALHKFSILFFEMAMTKVCGWINSLSPLNISLVGDGRSPFHSLTAIRQPFGGILHKRLMASKIVVCGFKAVGLFCLGSLS